MPATGTNSTQTYRSQGFQRTTSPPLRRSQREVQKYQRRGRLGQHHFEEDTLEPVPQEGLRGRENENENDQPLSSIQLYVIG
jgi:hypothetical protein